MGCGAVEFFGFGPLACGVGKGEAVLDFRGGDGAFHGCGLSFHEAGACGGDGLADRFGDDSFTGGEVGFDQGSGFQVGEVRFGVRVEVEVQQPPGGGGDELAGGVRVGEAHQEGAFRVLGFPEGQAVQGPGVGGSWADVLVFVEVPERHVVRAGGGEGFDGELDFLEHALGVHHGL